MAYERNFIVVATRYKVYLFCLKLPIFQTFLTEWRSSSIMSVASQKMRNGIELFLSSRVKHTLFLLSFKMHLLSFVYTHASVLLPSSSSFQSPALHRFDYYLSTNNIPPHSLSFPFPSYSCAFSHAIFFSLSTSLYIDAFI